MQEKQHPIGAVIGGLAGFVGGMIGLNKALREAGRKHRPPHHGLTFDTGGNISLAGGEHVQRLRKLPPIGDCPKTVPNHRLRFIPDEEQVSTVADHVAEMAEQIASQPGRSAPTQEVPK